MYVLSRTNGFPVVSGLYHPRPARSYQITSYAGYAFVNARRMAAEKLLRDYPGEKVIAHATSHDACVWLVGDLVFVLANNTKNN